MRIKDFLSPAEVILGIRARDKDRLLTDLAARAAAALDLPQQEVADAIMKRDELGSTGIGNGVSIPHARFRKLKRPFGIFARLEQPIEFDAIDNLPVDLVFLILLPALSQLDQLNALAAVARKLRNPEVLRILRAASGSAEVFQVLTS